MQVDYHNLKIPSSKYYILNTMIYLDHAATTPCDKRVVKKMLPYFDEIYGNPSGIYKVSRQAKKGMDEARKIIAKFLNCKTDEIVFTNGGTESDNLAILGVARIWSGSQDFQRGRSIRAQASNGASKPSLKVQTRPHIVTTQIEHSAVLNSCQQLEKEGLEVTYLAPNRNGIVSAEKVKKALKPNTILVSIMYANNEIGTIQPIAKIAKVIRDFRKAFSLQPSAFSRKMALPFFHTDACQATQYLEMDVETLGVDLLTFNGSKIYGPKGIGVLCVRSGIEIAPILFGGEQEKGLRPGTENVPAIVGLGEAVRLIDSKSAKGEQELRDLMIENLLRIENSELNGDPKKRLQNSVNIAFHGVEGEAAVLYLDERGIACSTGSACLSKTLKPSHVILALGKGEEAAHSSLRFTLGRKTTKKDIIYTIKNVSQVVKKLRGMSAINKLKVKRRWLNHIQ